MPNFTHYGQFQAVNFGSGACPILRTMDNFQQLILGQPTLLILIILAAIGNNTISIA